MANLEVVLVVVVFGFIGLSEGMLRVGYYTRTCPAAEAIVVNVVQRAVSADPRHAPRLLRLFFHDCFVEGCDGSILLDNGDESEKNARGNLGLGSFEVIENAKTQLEAACPGVVSCADIVALAARDAVFLSQGPFYNVPTGRKDGRISSVSLAANLPDVDDSIEVLKAKFKGKGLSPSDLVLLSAGGHTIGTTACFFMPRRLYNFTGNGDSDPTINPLFLPQLKSRCLFNGDVNVRLALDWFSEQKFDDQILRNIRMGFAVIASDARLYDDTNTRQILDGYVGFDGNGNGLSFRDDFAKAMVKMGNIGVKTRLRGEIRRVCSSVN